MGGMLTHPVTDKQSNQGEGLGLRYGLSSMQGWRSEMEDAHDVRIGLRYGLDDWSFFAVFDGHAGKRAAAFAAWNLLDFILKDSQFELETGNQSDKIFVEPDIGKINDAVRVENNSDKPSESSPAAPDHDGGVSSADVPCDVKSSEKGLCETIEQVKEANETSQPNNVQDAQGICETNNPKMPSQSVSKPNFISYPVLKQLELVESAIKSGFLRIDQSMRDSAVDMSGCTAVCTFISPTHLFIANCGDSRAVLYDGKSPKFVTEDHKPFKPKERQRIIEAGGYADQRINGTLAVSRALGDFEFKKDQKRGPCEQLVSPEPEVTVIERHPEDQFLVLACDGIWDVMNNDDLCKFIRYKLTVEENLEIVCSSVLDVCLHKGSRDNMSIIIVVFENGPKFSQEAKDSDKQNEELLVKIAESFDDGDNMVDFEDFLYYVKQMLREHENQVTLPPGAGIDAKFDLLKGIYEKKLDGEPVEAQTKEEAD